MTGRFTTSPRRPSGTGKNFSRMDSNRPGAHGIRFCSRPLWSVTRIVANRPAESGAAVGRPLTLVRHSSRLSRLQRFERQYALANRGHIRVRGDRDVKEADFARRHIVLFGDPGSNRWIAKLNGKPPLRWTKET